ncbi:hypothetical protein FACS1894103_7490 [Campylobacterota bacterium]|nr:hypothetical protein FACS1894103_7490 [Campylobacterota bacterium]
MVNEFDYYFIVRKDDNSFSLIDIVARDDEGNPSLISIEIDEPVPKKPAIACKKN